jgi:para-aminobenzoate synthetase component 1
MSFRAFNREIEWREPFELLARLSDRPMALLLESALAGPPLGRHSFLAVDPPRTLIVRGDEVRVDGQPSTVGPFEALERALAGFRLESRPDLPPFQTGAAGYFGYELNRWLEHLPEPLPDELGFPDMAIGLYDLVVAFDHERRRAWIVSSGYPETSPAPRETRARERLARLEADIARGDGARGAKTDAARAPDARSSIAGGPASGLESLLPTIAANGAQALRAARFPDGAGSAEEAGAPKGARRGRVGSNFSPEAYRRAVQRVIDYVHAGDVFQANLAQRFVAILRAEDTPLDLYARLCRRNPAPFAAYFDLGGSQVVSASPERFLELGRGVALTRPIKGTRPRGPTPAEDAALARELMTSAKDRAENVMIVDLLRNDLSRVCRPGTVRVPGLCELESYETVHHLVSTVRGETVPGTTAVGLLRAAFPGGSVTGAPKVRAMEIIRELEPHRRGVYCGSIGYIGFDGAMDTSIAIRTFAISGRTAVFHAGGGIVADSDPVAELEESRTKALALREAL